MQFKMLCQQSIDNVSRKRAYSILKESYKSLTQKAFASRVKEIAAISAAAASQKAGYMLEDIDSALTGRKLYAEDIFEITNR